MSDLKHYQLIAQPSMEPQTVIDIWSTPENIDALERTLRRLVFPYAFQLYVAPGPHTQHPGNKKPPLGVLPLRLWQESNPNPDLATIAKRHIDVCNAVIRYHQAGIHVPPQWLREMGIIVETTRDPGQTTGGDGQETQTPHGGG